MTATPSLTVTPSRIGFTLSILAVLTFGWNVAGYVRGQEYRITALETYQAENKQLNRDMLSEIRRLSEAVTKLSTIIEGVNTLDGKQASIGAGEGQNVADALLTGGTSFAQDFPKLEISK
jgi:hypothetical protein